VSYELHLVCPGSRSYPVGQTGGRILKGLWAEAKTTVIFDADIKPESSGKYLVSRTLFPIDLDKYLDK
jgi:hypothetical protein